MEILYVRLLLFYGLGVIINIGPHTTDASFDSIYVHAATTLSALDVEKAIHLADSLYINSENSMQEMKSLLLIAALKGSIGRVAEALAHALEAEAIAIKYKNYEWQVRIAGFLSTTFRGISLTDEGKKYLNVAHQVNKKAKGDSSNFKMIQALLYQEKAFYKIAERDFRGAIGELKSAESEVFKTPQEARSSFFLATNYHLLGTALIGLNEYRIARDKLTLALDELGDKESELKAFIYTDFAEIEMHYKNYDAAYELLKRAEGYLATSDNFNIRSSLFKGFSKYYKTIGKKKEAIQYNEQYIDFVKAFSNSRKLVSHQLLQQVRSEKEDVIKRNILLINASLCLLVVSGFVVFMYRNTRKKEKIKYEKVMRKIEALKPSFEKVNKSINHHNTPEDLFMPKETEERILRELDKLEETAFFIQKDISSSFLAIKLNTNPKYLSYVINTHKGKDFNNYINELRVGFAIDKLHTDPNYLNYKLSYIAEECGFSSHSKFAAVFKTVTELSPSVFVTRLKQDMLEEA